MIRIIIVNLFKFIWFLFLSFLCVCGNIGNVWAEEPESGTIMTQSNDSGVSVSENVQDFNTYDDSSWQSGFDIRLSVAAILTVPGKDHDHGLGYDDDSHGEHYFNLGISGELGYRWTYGGIYLYLDSFPLDDVVIGAGLKGIFYWPLDKNFEFVFGFGIAYHIYWLSLPLSTGIMWHHKTGISLGFHLSYQPFIGFDVSSDWDEEGTDHFLGLNIVIGYTF